MPIYEYRCSDCGFQEEHLQKISEAPLTMCPACGKPKFEKQLSAAGFQLKGSGWYATDFKGGSKPAAAKADAKGEAKGEEKGGAKSEAKPESKSDSKSEAKADSAKVDKTPASTTN